MTVKSYASSGKQTQSMNISFPCSAGESSEQTCKKGYCPPITLEKHLFSFSGDKAYQVLWSSWVIEKELYEKQLENVPESFPSYSSHTAEHSEIILTRIEALLGEDRIRLLTPTDTWLLLQCAYTHDLGMCVSESERDRAFADSFENIESFKSLLEIEDFRSFLYELEREYFRDTSNVGHALFSSVRFLLRAGDSNDDQTLRELANRLKSLDYSRARSMVTLVTTSYFRKRHAKRTRRYLLDRAQEDSGNGLFPLRLRKIVAEIDYCHGGSWKDVLKLPQKETGFSTDFIHPQFIAALLRLGDLLDLDSNRFNEFQIERLSSMPKLSAAHELKHMAISDFLVSPKEIRVTARYELEEMRQILDAHYFKDQAISPEEKDLDTIELIDRSAKSLREWLNMIQEELKQFSNEWNSIIPDNMTGSPASFRKSNIYVLDRENPVEEDDAFLHYSVNPARFAKILEGSDINRSTWAFMRELTQNAADASKRQLGRKALHFSPADHTDFSAYPKFYDNRHLIHRFEPVRVVVNCIHGSDNAPAKFEFVFIDSGIGITFNKLKQMRQIGAISKTPEERREIRDMPPWLKPAGEFGIGMQSAFSAASSLSIVTYPSDKAGMPSGIKRSIKLYCPDLGGDIVNREEWLEHERCFCGSEVTVEMAASGENTLKSIFEQASEGSTDSDAHSELFFAYYQNKNQSPVLDKDVVFSQIKKYIVESFTEDVIGIRFYFMEGAKPCTDWREYINGYEKDHKPDIEFRLPKLSESISAIPGQSNFLSPSEPDEKSSDKAVYFWYNSAVRDTSEDLSVLLSFKNMLQTVPMSSEPAADKNKFSIRLFYRGIAICSEPFNKGLFNAFRLPGIDLKINIMSGNISQYLEINRNFMKPRGFSELHSIIREALKGFYHSVSVWEKEKEEMYRSDFWEQNPEHRLLYRLACRAFGFDEVRSLDEKAEIRRWNISDKVSDDAKRMNSVLYDPEEGKPFDFGSIWFTDLRNKIPDTLAGNTSTVTALSDWISEAFDFKYDKLQLIRSSEWDNKFYLRYTLSTGECAPLDMSDRDYGIFCVSMLRKLLERYERAEKGSYLRETIGNYVPSIPAKKPYCALSVSQLPAESPGERLSRFRGFIVLPFKVRELSEYLAKIEYPAAIGPGRRDLFPDGVLQKLCGTTDEKSGDASEQFVRQMRKFIEQKIAGRLEKHPDLKQVRKLYSELLSLFSYEPKPRKAES